MYYTLDPNPLQYQTFLPQPRYTPKPPLFPLFTIYNPHLLPLATPFPKQNTHNIFKPFLESNDLVILSQISDILTCNLCNTYFSDAITTSCNHTFCLKCFMKFSDNKEKCPYCKSQAIPVRSSSLIHKLSQLTSMLTCSTPRNQFLRSPYYPSGIPAPSQYNSFIPPSALHCSEQPRHP